MSLEEIQVRWNKWDVRFLRLAREVSTWSKDPSTQVGACIVDNNRRVISVGFNGLPRAIPDSDRILNDREEKYEHIIHAEINALLFAQDRPLSSARIYTYPFPPCSRCAAVIIQAGIRSVVSVAPTPELQERWADSLKRAQAMFNAARVDFQLYKHEWLDGDMLS